VSAEIRQSVAGSAPKDRLRRSTTRSRTCARRQAACRHRQEKVSPWSGAGRGCERLDKAGNPVNLPEKDAVVMAAFASDIGVDNEALRTATGMSGTT
jgi:peptidyl-prolyl cis-trans isomerase D